MAENEIKKTEAEQEYCYISLNEFFSYIFPFSRDFLGKIEQSKKSYAIQLKVPISFVNQLKETANKYNEKYKYPIVPFNRIFLSVLQNYKNEYFKGY